MTACTTATCGRCGRCDTEPEPCAWCTAAPIDPIFYPYCSSRCVAQATEDSPEDLGTDDAA